MTENLFAAAHACLTADTVADKCRLAVALAEDWAAGRLAVDPDIELPEVIEAGRPARPELVSPRELPRRRLGSPEGLAAMIHAVAHIEFNAINLACDAVYRFRDMPAAYYADWIQVAREEAYHFSLLQERLGELGKGYGDYPAHNGLWDLAVKTAHDPLVRMALVPRVMEARGLDVTPDMMNRFQSAGDSRTAAILRIILRDEVGHVAFGSRWFHYLCEQRGLEPEATYFGLLTEYFPDGLRCPLHVEARREAGFSENELNKLESLCKKS
jgi:uncharacterized ferritin-like protein (DUF455 family)